MRYGEDHIIVYSIGEMNEMLMQNLLGKQIVVGITGGIAAYKSAELVRKLCGQGATVRVVMTQAAKEFISPLTLQALSGKPVAEQLFDLEAEAAMGHIELARWADIIIIAPASADFIASLAHGHANNLLTTICIATQAKILVVPAMNQQMWQNHFTYENVQRLLNHGILTLGPASGTQACGDIGPGRMFEPDDIVKAVIAFFATDKLHGQRVLVTAGPTQEAIDPVRYISNHSSGKMGYAMAEAAARAGAQVTLLSGPTHLSCPPAVDRVNFVTAAQLRDEVMARIKAIDIFIACAAVADYRPVSPANAKIKRTPADINLKLVANPDILAEVADLKAKPMTVGFAAETHDLVAHAKKKLAAKGLDMIVANHVGGEHTGFNSDLNEVTVITKQKELHLPLAAKILIAEQIIDLITGYINPAESC